MKGYEISYQERSGVLTSTFFGAPTMSKGFGMSEKAAVLFMFQQAHPGCKVLAVKACLLSEFEERHGLKHTS